MCTTDVPNLDMGSLARQIEGYSLLVMGPNGIGKGTQVGMMKEKLSPFLNFPSISVGDKLREIGASGNRIGKIIKPYLDEGEHVPNHLTRRHVIEPFFRATPPKSLNIVDGFPRNAEQVYMLTELVAERKFLAVVFDARDEICLARARKRIEEGSTRSDGTLAKERDRLKLYRKHAPIVDRALRDLGVPILIFSAEGNEKVIHADVMNDLNVVVKNGIPKLGVERGVGTLSRSVAV